jgi:hypothetical protein
MVSVHPGWRAESTMIDLERDKSVAQLAVSADTLAVGIGKRGLHDSDSPPTAFEERSAVTLLRGAGKVGTTPWQRGSLRSIVPTSSGFLALRVDTTATPVTSHVLRVDSNAHATELPPIERDLLGVWAEGGEVFAYGARFVLRWSAKPRGWVEVRLDAGVAPTAIRRIVRRKRGGLAVVTERAVSGFAHLDARPTFVTSVNAYPYPMYLYGDEGWWLVVEGKGTQKIARLTDQGALDEVATPKTAHVHDLLFTADRVIFVCSREGGNVHRSSYYWMDRAGTGPLHGPFILPEDTIKACVWGDRIISASALPRVVSTPIAH